MLRKIFKNHKKIKFRSSINPKPGDTIYLNTVCSFCKKAIPIGGRYEELFNEDKSQILKIHARCAKKIRGAKVE